MDCRQMDWWDNRWVYVLNKNNVDKLSMQLMQAKNIEKIWLIGEIFKILIK